ncbi:hypothetical protein PIB30_100263, partial [Stylosanthes scabra]|nr:hypothetical protein [Stylosanthes scabra]
SINPRGTITLTHFFYLIRSGALAGGSSVTPQGFRASDFSCKHILFLSDLMVELVGVDPQLILPCFHSFELFKVLSLSGLHSLKECLLLNLHASKLLIEQGDALLLLLHVVLLKTCILIILRLKVLVLPLVVIFLIASLKLRHWLVFFLLFIVLLHLHISTKSGSLHQPSCNQLILWNEFTSPELTHSYLCILAQLENGARKGQLAFPLHPLSNHCNVTAMISSTLTSSPLMME